MDCHDGENLSKSNRQTPPHATRFCSVVRPEGEEPGSHQADLATRGAPIAQGPEGRQIGIGVGLAFFSVAFVVFCPFCSVAASFGCARGCGGGAPGSASV